MVWSALISASKSVTVYWWETATPFWMMLVTDTSYARSA